MQWQHHPRMEALPFQIPIHITVQVAVVEFQLAVAAPMGLPLILLSHNLLTEMQHLQAPIRIAVQLVTMAVHLVVATHMGLHLMQLQHQPRTEVPQFQALIFTAVQLLVVQQHLQLATPMVRPRMQLHHYLHTETLRCQAPTLLEASQRKTLSPLEVVALMILQQLLPQHLMVVLLDQVPALAPTRVLLLLTLSQLEVAARIARHPSQ